MLKLLVALVAMANASCGSSADCAKCAQDQQAICMAATNQGLSCAGICTNPPASFRSACQTMKEQCGCDSNNNCACK